MLICIPISFWTEHHKQSLMEEVVKLRPLTRPTRLINRKIAAY